MIKLWFHWGLLVLAWIISSYAIGIWPSVTELNMEARPDFWSGLLYKPFHYMLGFIGILFFVIITIQIVKKVWYELRVAFLFRIIPYEVIILLLLLCFIYMKAMLSLFYLTVGLTIVITSYELITYLPHRRKEVVFVRE